MSDPYGHHAYPPRYGPGAYEPGAHGPGVPAPQAPPALAYPQPVYGAPPPPPPGYQAPAGYAGYGPPGAPEAPLSPPPASFGARAGAYLIDLVPAAAIAAAALYGPLFLLIWLLDPNNSATGENIVLTCIPLAFLLSAFCSFSYYWIPHARSGRTLGKLVLGIRVIRMKTGEPPSLGLSAGRQLVALAMASLSCIGLLVDLLWPLWDGPLCQALHDKAVGTRVVKVRGLTAGPYPEQEAAFHGPSPYSGPGGTGGGRY
ncbi:RDD family protein [Streptomonospora litoralis]|uniref:RDD family protein n=1 Tax=Streptomonospora litoralis TaxID=2498135 RepID=A0A4P6PZD7_9ACTN|nr:RDD family protein [Streptomonospora litoralis]QBI53503.1 RDD family protein [Streptomonospora litoralis]